MYVSFTLGVLGGLLSGILVYFVRQKVRADRLRTAIATEVRNTPLDALATGLKGEVGLQTPIIDANLDKIHLLTKDEIVEVENFHRHMQQVQEHYEEEKQDDGRKKIHIPSKLQRKSRDYARNTAYELESHIWNRSNIIFAVKFWSDERGDEERY
ncbi:hypothetical protein [Halapricum desulfuricans]|uniref:hypothetical protein n=1 Tax=Halapricum desulfuricans TaxID=2841257 RepID=UPI001E2B9F1A|nr:hypothetical protein [Halapricum desulfuricans]